MTVLPFSANKKLTVVNLLGGPGTGKSTTAYGIAYQLKRSGVSVELIHEVAKDLTFENRPLMLAEQDWITSNQHQLQRRLVYHDIDVCVTDSCLLLAAAYVPEWYPPTFVETLKSFYESYDNINIFLERNPDICYDPVGRSQTLEEAQAKDQLIKSFIETNYPNDVHYVTAGDDAVTKCITIINQHLTNKATNNDLTPNRDPVVRLDESFWR